MLGVVMLNISKQRALVRGLGETMERLNQGSLLRVPMVLAMGSTRDHPSQMFRPSFLLLCRPLGSRGAGPELVPMTPGHGRVGVGELLLQYLKKKKHSQSHRSHSCHLLPPASAEPMHRKALHVPS